MPEDDVAPLTVAELLHPPRLYVEPTPEEEEDFRFALGEVDDDDPIVLEDQPGTERWPSPPQDWVAEAHADELGAALEEHPEGHPDEPEDLEAPDGVRGVSISGWPVSASPRYLGVRSLRVPGTNTYLPIRGDVGPLLIGAATEFHRYVEPLRTGWSWGYNYRRVTGGYTPSYHAAAIACFAGDTEIVTRDGIRRIGDLAGTDAKILTRDPFAGMSGRWRSAPIRSFGVQPTRTVTVTRHRRRVEIRATDEHRWYVRRPVMVESRDGLRRHSVLPRVHEVTTAELRPDDVLLSARPRSEAKYCQVAPVGVLAGMVYGDGTATRTAGCAISLFGAKTELLRFIPEPRTAVRSRADGLVEVHVDNLPLLFKQLPDLRESTQYLLGWLAGMVATDGDIGASVHLSTADEDTATFIRDLCPRLGIGVSVRTKKRGEGAYKEGTDYVLTFVKSTLGPEFFVRSDQRAAFGDAVREPADWTVVSVGPENAPEEVFCAVVEGTRSFALADGILTGNCDLNAPLHPYGVSPYRNFSSGEIALCRAIARKYGLRWGGDYRTNPDAMHFEIILGRTAAFGLVRRLQSLRAVGARVPQRPPKRPTIVLENMREAARTDRKRRQGRGSHEFGTRLVERALVAEGLLDRRFAGDGYWGSTTAAAYRRWERRLHYDRPDEVPGGWGLTKLGRRRGFRVT